MHFLIHHLSNPKEHLGVFRRTKADSRNSIHSNFVKSKSILIDKGWVGLDARIKEVNNNMDLGFIIDGKKDMAIRFGALNDPNGTRG